MSLDEFREAGAFMDDDEKEGKTSAVRKSRPRSPTSRSKGNFLGMTSAQRFILSLMLLFMVFMLGVFCLIATGRVVP